MIHECERPDIYRDAVVKYDGADGGGTYWQPGRYGAWIRCIHFCPFCGVPLGGGRAAGDGGGVRPWCRTECGMSTMDHVTRSMINCRRGCRGGA